jgi:hypothetical protein
MCSGGGGRVELEQRRGENVKKGENVQEKGRKKKKLK